MSCIRYPELQHRLVLFGFWFFNNKLWIRYTSTSLLGVQWNSIVGVLQALPVRPGRGPADAGPLHARSPLLTPQGGGQVWRTQDTGNRAVFWYLYCIKITELLCQQSSIAGCFILLRAVLRIRILLSPSKNSKKNLDSYCFVTSFWLFFIRKIL